MNCKYCNYDQEMCCAKFDGYTCTRELGHGGYHVACGSGRVIYKKWPNKKKGDKQ